MAVKPIGMQLRLWGSPSITAAASEASKNTSKNSCRAHQKGLWAEHKVIQALQSRGWRLKWHRCKTPFAEIDLAFQKENRLLVVEVKSVRRRSDCALWTLKSGQIARLRRATEWLLELGYEAQLVLVLVDARGRLHFTQDF